ncbi:TauD/TfdA family dioxygenase [Betaproteobacteria bacterium SCN2]|nr:TauD/TfdA family dioxygenase [Betaproteobacteria bacterium SCN2]
MSLIRPDSPFHPDNGAAYQAWRDAKLRGYPQRVEELVVKVADPKALTAKEHAALLERCRKTNMAIYAGPDLGEDKDIPRLMGRQFGLERLDANLMSDEDDISTLTVAENGEKKGDFIPYTDRPIRWHTDGYYNRPDRQILGMMLHCAAPAAEGGANALLDHEILYLLLRDENPAHIRALMQEDAMSIPPRMDANGVARAEETGPVFSTLPGGQLHLRYTARTRSIAWKQDAATQAAVAAIDKLLGQDLPWKFQHRLEAGMGLLCNNVLHDRTGFVDSPGHKRIMYRARYYDRIGQT